MIDRGSLWVEREVEEVKIVKATKEKEVKINKEDADFEAAAEALAASEKNLLLISHCLNKNHRDHLKTSLSCVLLKNKIVHNYFKIVKGPLIIKIENQQYFQITITINYQLTSRDNTTWHLHQQSRSI